MRATLLQGDSAIILKTLADNSVEAVITDCPAGIDFMSKDWDSDKGGRDNWIAWLSGIFRECYRIMKPGAYIVVWSIPRTSHWTGMAIENAGFEINNVITHIQGQGFPHGLELSKAIDRAKGVKRKVGGVTSTNCPDFPELCKGHPDANGSLGGGVMRHALPTIPATELAKEFDGYNTQLKPAVEFWWLAQKPVEKNYVYNAEKWGIAGLNIDGCRVEVSNDEPNKRCKTGEYNPSRRFSGDFQINHLRPATLTSGRYPANLVLSHSEGCKIIGYRNAPGYKINRWTDNAHPFGNGAGNEYETLEIPGGQEPIYECDEKCPVHQLNLLSGHLKSGTGAKKKATAKGHQGHVYGAESRPEGTPNIEYGDEGGAARFFTNLEPLMVYQAKSNASDRNYGLPKGQVNKHSTVKSIALMRWLCRLIKPPKGGVILDPFAGSGTTLIAALLEGYTCIGIEIGEEYFKLAQTRIDYVLELATQPELEIT